MIRWSKILMLFSISLVLACSNEPKGADKSLSAEGFKQVGFSHISALQLWESQDSLKFLVKVPFQTEAIEKTIARSKTGVRLICLSTTHIGFLESLNSLDNVIAVSNGNLVYSESMNRKIERGEVVNLGGDTQVDIEFLMSLNPDLILYYDFDPTTSKLIDKMESLGLNVLRINEFLENSPLGKAEWLKLFGYILGKEEKANSIFEEIESQYLSLTQKRSNSLNKPSVLFGLPWKGTWHQPGGNSFQSSFIFDAGGDYLWKKDTSHNALILDREVILDQGINADVWLHPNNETSLNAVLSSDESFELFKSVTQGRVYNNNARLNENKGNDYWESGIVHPHIILKDLLFIFYPEEFPDHELVYYRKLKSDE